ncbi:DUF1801 domain-containing protein [Inhella sp.]|uniref:DUF1801 domain-containing protein n=1 Tax=Inhella sp. TaxID=1921806 RepID=UPI0035B0EAA2
MRPDLTPHRLFLLPGALPQHPAVQAWLQACPGELGQLARQHFASLRACGADVTELQHDGHPTACVGGAAFAYVNAFRAHVNLGFFHGTALPDPTGLLEGSGRFMRHVKLRPGRLPPPQALQALMDAAYRDICQRLAIS